MRAKIPTIPKNSTKYSHYIITPAELFIVKGARRKNERLRENQWVSWPLGNLSPFRYVASVQVTTNWLPRTGHEIALSYLKISTA